MTRLHLMHRGSSWWLYVISATAATVAVVALVIGQVHQASTENSLRGVASKAKHQSKCLNKALGARSDLTQKSAIAQRNFAAADHIYNEAINTLIAHPPRNPAQQAAAKALFTTASAAKAKASGDYLNAMNAILRTANAHPLGKC